MKVVVQRVKQASVSVNETVVGNIGSGLLLLFGVHKEDTPEKTLWLAKKIANLRIFKDDQGKMNRSILDTKGQILVVSQFTLYADCSTSRRPDFIQAALPEPAFLLYEKFLSELNKELGEPIQTGIFGALMEVNLTNDGPVTIILEK